MEKENYEFMSAMVLSLLDTDHLLTYDFIAGELHISRTYISAMKQGKDMSIHHYLLLINYAMEIIDLDIDLDTLLKVLRKVLTEKRDLFIGAAPHCAHGNPIPEEWERVLTWKDMIR